MTRQEIGKPKTRLFVLLSVIWLGVSLVNSIPFWLDDWPPSFSGVEWFSILLMVPLPAFVLSAIVCALTEVPRQITVEHRNPDHDIRKLY